jgi:hypothetical protein
MSKVTFGRDHGLLLSFFFHWPISGFLGLIMLGYLSSPMATSLPLVDLA